MNLSKIEKAFIIILVVGGIIAAGIFLFIMPAKDDIDSAKTKLTNIQKEEENLNAELAREQTIDNEIKTAKESAEALEGSFYPDLTTYEATEIVLAHLKKCKLTTLGIKADLITTRELELELYQDEPVVYDLKNYSQSARGTDEDALLEGQFKDGNKVYTITANNATEISITDEAGNVVEPKNYTETMVKAHKEALCKSVVASDTTQTVSLLKVSLDVTGEYKDYLNFIDYIYNLERATYMNVVEIPMTVDAAEVEGLDQLTESSNVDVLVACEDDTVVTVPVEIMFFGVEQMEELETIDASGVSIVVNQ